MTEQPEPLTTSELVNRYWDMLPDERPDDRTLVATILDRDATIRQRDETIAAMQASLTARSVESEEAWKERYDAEAKLEQAQATIREQAEELEKTSKWAADRFQLQREAEAQLAEKDREIERLKADAQEVDVLRMLLEEKRSHIDALGGDNTESGLWEKMKRQRDEARAELAQSEFWKDIPGFEGEYQASTHGRIRSLRFRNGTADVPRGEPKLLTPYESNKYLRVTVSSHGDQTCQYVHRLVLLTFYGLPEHGHECSHQDGNRLNNFASNLRWSSRKDNAQMRQVHGTEPRGEQRINARLRDQDIPVIRERIAAGHTDTEIAHDYGVSSGTIHSVRTGRAWTHVE